MPLQQYFVPVLSLHINKVRSIFGGLEKLIFTRNGPKNKIKYLFLSFFIQSNHNYLI